MVDWSRRPAAAAARNHHGDGVVDVLVEGATARVHEEVGDGGHFESELVGDGCLHVLVRAPRFLEYGEQRATLDVGEDEPRFLVDRVDTGRARRADAAGSDGASCRPVGCQASLVVL